MSRFFGLVLMVVTVGVIVELVASGGFEPVILGSVLGAALLFLGLLLGFLATQRHYLWAIIASLAAVVPQVVSGRIRIPLPAGQESGALALLCVPPLALFVGSYVGARLLRRRHHGPINFEAE